MDPVTEAYCRAYFGVGTVDLPAKLAQLVAQPNPLFASGVKDPAMNPRDHVPEPLPPAPPPVNPYNVPGAPRSPDPVEDVEPEKVPSKPAPHPDEEWLERDTDRKATVRDKPAPTRKR